MTTLTLDQLKTFLCEQNDAKLAAQLMRDMGFDVRECTVGFPTYHFDFKPYTVIFRDDEREGGFSFTILERFDSKERKAFLGSQQQPTDTVPAVSTVAEARPELTCFCPSCNYDQATAQQDPEAEFYHVNCSVCGLDADRDALELCLSFDPDTEFRNLMGFFRVLGNVATRDESYQRAFVHNLLSNSHTHLHHLFDASLRMCLDAQLATLDQIAPAHLKARE